VRPGVIGGVLGGVLGGVFSGTFDSVDGGVAGRVLASLVSGLSLSALRVGHEAAAAAAAAAAGLARAEAIFAERPARLKRSRGAAAVSCGGGGGADASTDIAETCIASTNCVVAIFRTSLVAELSRGYNTKRVHFGSETSFYVQPARLTREESAWVTELVAGCSCRRRTPTRRGSTMIKP